MTPWDPPWIPQTAPWPQWNLGLSITENPPWIGTSHYNFPDLLFISHEYPNEISWNIAKKISHWDLPLECTIHVLFISQWIVRTSSAACAAGWAPSPAGCGGSGYWGRPRWWGAAVGIQLDLGVSINGGIQKRLFFFRENPSYKWMITGGTMA